MKITVFLISVTIPPCPPLWYYTGQFKWKIWAHFLFHCYAIFSFLVWKDGNEIKYQMIRFDIIIVCIWVFSESLKRFLDTFYISVTLTFDPRWPISRVWASAASKHLAKTSSTHTHTQTNWSENINSPRFRLSVIIKVLLMLFPVFIISRTYSRTILLKWHSTTV